MKKFLLLILALVLCFSFVGCGRSDICEYKTENDVLLFKIRKTPTFDGQHFSKIEFLDYKDEVDRAYYARKNTYLTISNNIPISDELPFTLSKETFDHYGANPNGTFYIKIVEINKKSGHPVFEEICFINGSSLFSSSMECRYFSESSDKSIGYKTDRIEIFLKGKIIICCELSHENKEKKDATLGEITIETNGNCEGGAYYVCHEYVNGQVYKTYYFDLYTGDPIDEPQRTE